MIENVTRHDTCKSIVFVSLLFFFAFVIFPFTVFSVEIADVPIENAVAEPPAIVMFVLDNSGSMDSELMTPETNGRFGDKFYVFPDEGYFPKIEHAYGSGYALDLEQRRDWRTQWAGFNRIYFDPALTYSPWPDSANHQFVDADLHIPYSNPYIKGAWASRCGLAAPFFEVKTTTGEALTVPNAHYFTALDQGDRQVVDYFLVTWQDKDHDGRLDLGNGIAEDQRRYFRFLDDGDGLVEDNELSSVDDALTIRMLQTDYSNDAGAILRTKTDAEQLQNYANWFMYHRRREFVLKDVVAHALCRMRRTYVGFYTLNQGPRLSAKPVGMTEQDMLCGSDGAGMDDHLNDLLEALYAIESSGGTPLRSALDDIGRYFHQERTSLLGDTPFFSESCGGGCQRTIAVVITDGFWNDDFKGLGNVDINQGAPYADPWSDTLADIAMYYYINDLASSLPDLLPVKACDQVTHQHMTTHTLSFGVYGAIDPYDIDGDGLIDSPGYFQDPCFVDPRTPKPAWPQPIPEQPSVIDDVWHAAVNGRGLYFNADDPDALAGAMNDIIGDIHTKEACGASVAVQGALLKNESVVFQTRYRTDDWTGDLLAWQYRVGAEYGQVASDVPLWRASRQMRLPGINADSRRIITYGGIWQDPEGVPFRYDLISKRQQCLLGSDLIRGSDRDDDARTLLEYLRGRDTQFFRQRSSLLGDMVHSAPVVFGETVFVGANDGMLHAFDARSGDERFAYIPNLVMTDITRLAEPGYKFEHRFFVDGTPTIGDVGIGPHHRRTYLVGCLGKGGQGYYCLLVGEQRRSEEGAAYGDFETSVSLDAIGADTEEADIAKLVRWEYPKPDISDDDVDNDNDGQIDQAAETDPDMGFSFGQGYAVNANTSEEDFRTIVVFGNGYNSKRGHAVLYIVDAHEGKLLRKIDTGAGDDNGLSTPALIDVNMDRRVDYAYAGDLNGNLWKFDLTSADIERWGVAYGEDVDGNVCIDAFQGDRPAPLFQAAGQSITGRPDIMSAKGICAANAPGYMVVFGTGRLLGVSDRRNVDRQSIFAIWDFGDDGDDSEYLGAITDRSEGTLACGLRLVPQSIVSQDTVDGIATRRLSTAGVDFSMQPDNGDGDHLRANNMNEASPDPALEAGWFLDFPVPPEANAEPGERVLGNAVIRGGRVVITSYAPDMTPCTGGGNSWVYLVSACQTGDVDTDDETMGCLQPMTAQRYAGRINMDPVILKESSDATVDQLLLTNDKGAIIRLPFLGERWGRAYWRQNID